MSNLTLSVGFDPADLQNAINSVINRTYTLRGINANSITQPLGRISASASEFQKSMEASNARVIAFGASAGVIYAISSAFRGLLKSTVDVETALTEINSIFNLSASSMKTFSAGLFAAANSASVSFYDAAKAATEFSRQGLAVEETLKHCSFHHIIRA